MMVTNSDCNGFSTRVQAKARSNLVKTLAQQKVWTWEKAMSMLTQEKLEPVAGVPLTVALREYVPR